MVITRTYLEEQIAKKNREIEELTRRVGALSQGLETSKRQLVILESSRQTLLSLVPQLDPEGEDIDHAEEVAA